jgi:hypothetical protein
VVQVVLRLPVQALSNIREELVPAAPLPEAVVEVAEPGIRLLGEAPVAQLAGRAETMAEGMAPMGIPVAIVVLAGLLPVAAEAERIVNIAAVLTLAAPGQEVRSGLPMCQYRMHPRFILNTTMVKSLSIT